MFNSTVLEVGIALIFTFLTISLISGAIVEAIASGLKWRANTLLSGIKELLNDPDFKGLAQELYAHASINPRGPGTKTSKPAYKNKPTYIDKEQFANALMDITGLSAAIAGAAPPLPPGAHLVPPTEVDKLKDAVDNKISPPAAAAAAPAGPANPQITQLLHGIIDRTLGNPQEIKTELANWFDNGMDRLSGAYKRKTQLVNFSIALIVSAFLNVDSITITKAVWEQPALLATLKVDKSPSMEDALKYLNANLPVGWSHAWFEWEKKDANGNPIKENGNPKFEFAWPSLGVGFAGWLITAIATLFGAPFWFDTLQKVTRLKGAGPSPEEKKENRAAAS
jgi:hypothetical protein